MKILQKNLVTIFVIIILVVGGFLFVQSVRDKDSETKTTTSEQTANDSITLTVKDGENIKEFEVVEGVGKTALEVTEEAVEIEKTGEGKDAFITAINGRVADSNKKEFWKLVINGEDAQVGAGSYTVAEGDTITWEIDTF